MSEINQRIATAAIFTAADLRDISSRPELDRLQRVIEARFQRCAEGNWLALGLDILTEGLTCYGGTPPKDRPQLRESLAERVAEAAAEATNEYPDQWDGLLADLTYAWLDISPYRLWKIIDEARRSGLAEYEDQLLDMALGLESGSTMGGVISEAFSDGVRKWQAERQAEDDSCLLS